LAQAKSSTPAARLPSPRRRARACARPRAQRVAAVAYSAVATAEAEWDEPGVVAGMGTNCMASVSIGCLFCCQGCNAEKLRNAFTFLPPQPSYTIVEEAAEGSNANARGGKLQFISEPIKGFAFYQQAAKNAAVHVLSTSRGERIPVVWVRNGTPNGNQNSTSGGRKGSPLVILHCHGNATDIGVMMGPYFELTKQLGCEVVGVEYSGYGTSTGAPTSGNCLADAEAAYNFVVGSGVPPERIIAYGQSVGSGPALALAARRPLGGVILHSAMLSGIKVIDPQPESCCKPSCMYCCFDFFHNDRHIKQVTCPAFIIHGMMDDIIPLYHGVRLAEGAPKPCKWPGYFPRDAGHNDIVETNAGAYFRELAGFLRNVQERADGVSRGAAGPSMSSIGKPAQVEMRDHGGPDVNPETIHYAEPAVGPQDGRYAQLRAGQGHGNVAERGGGK